MVKRSFLSYFLMILLFWACESKPKIIAEDSGTETSAVGTGTNDAQKVNTAQKPLDVHQVLAKDFLQAERYTYLLVEENNRTYWLATAKTEVEKGKNYMYRGGLLKTNFESQEFNRTFDTIYLVSNIIDAAAHPGGNIPMTGGSITSSVNSPDLDPEAIKNAIKLSDLFAKKDKYNGKLITVAGECVKVNNGIMGKNWVHIQDGSQSEGKTLDLTVTTNMNIKVGSKVALQGKIALNKDFGAGYRYDIIMEDAQ